MYELTHYAFCESIESTADGKQRIIGPLAEIPLVSVPGQFSFAFSFGIRNVDVNNPNRVHIAITDSEGNIIMDSTGELEAVQGATAPIGSLSIGMDVRNLLFKATGVHDVRIEFNDELVQTLHLYVTRITENARTIEE